MITIGEPVRGYPLPLRRKAIFGAMEVGHTREITGDRRERRNWRKSAHWVGREFGWSFQTLTRGETLVVTRIA